MGRGRRAIGALATIVLLASGILAVMPVDAQQGAVTVVARGLTTPGGFTWNENDVLFVALAGSGGSDPVLPEVPAPLGPLTSGDTGAVAVIDTGCPAVLATGIPSIRTATGRIQGAEAVAELDGQLYLLVSDAGADGTLDLASGVYRIGGDGSLDLIADHAAFLRENPPAAGDAIPGNPVALVAGDGALWIADQQAGSISRLIPGGQETLVANLSGRGFAPTDLALGADGSIYVSGFGDPNAPGSASVLTIAADGEVQTVWTGLTMASGIAIGNDGALYATELASGVSEAAVNGIPGSGRLLRQTSAGDAEVVADGLMYPAALATGPDGAVYFVTGALGSGNGSGSIGRYAPDGSAAGEAPLDCQPIAETTSAEITGAVASPAAVDRSPVATATPSPTPTQPAETWTPDGAVPTGEIVEVGLFEYGIDMPTVLPAGPVTFVITNNGALTHSFRIDGPGVEVELTMELEPGQQGAFSVLLQSGVYSIVCPVPGHRDNGMSLVLTVN